MPSISDEQIEQAKSVDILAYLRTHEPYSIRKSKGSRDEYYLVEHDSLKISNGKFHWFSRGIGGYSALDFLVKVRGMDFVEAVQHLTGDSVAAFRDERSPPPKSGQKQHKPFTLPTANTNNDHVYAYLRGRGIDREIIKRCIDAGTLYESAKSRNCVFVGFDGDKPRFACERGTTDDYKKDCTGSDKRFSFVLPPKTPDSHNLIVCESACDVLSHATIHKIDGDKWDGYRLSLSGVSSAALMSFLERNPQIENVQLSLDNDKAGREATDRIIRELLSDKRFSRFRITVAPVPFGKDCNDCLQAIIQLNKQKSRSDRPKEAVCLF